MLLFGFGTFTNNNGNDTERKKINFRPKKFNHRNLSNLSTSTQQHSLTVRERQRHRSRVFARVFMSVDCGIKYYIIMISINYASSRPQLWLSLCIWMEWNGMYSIYVSVRKRAREREREREKRENETKRRTHNSNYQIKNVNLEVLFVGVCVHGWLSEWVFGQSANAKWHNRTLFTA